MGDDKGVSLFMSQRPQTAGCDVCALCMSTKCLKHCEENDMLHISGCVNISTDHLQSWKVEAVELCSIGNLVNAVHQILL